MMFWIAASALLGLTCLALLAALARTADASAEGHDRAFYEQQLIEIDRQRASKFIGVREAEAARTEAARRLLAAAEGEQRGDPEISSRRLAAVIVLAIVPTVTLAIYVPRGAPEQPSMPLASRERPAPDLPQPTDVLAAVQQIETHLARNPDDGRGHEVVAPIYLRLGRHGDAVSAFSSALRLLGPTADRHANLGEAMLFQSDGIVTAAARSAFEDAAALDPRHAKARFFLALAAQQEGDAPKAARLLADLRGDLPDGDLKSEIDRQIARLGGAPAGGAAIAALPDQERQAAIRTMVEGLASRLAVGGGTADDWAKLIRALTVLKEADRAQAILAEARQKFAADPEGLKRIEAAGREP